MRALVFACTAALVAACSIGALDGFSGQDVTDGGAAPGEGGGDSVAPIDAPTDGVPPIDGTPVTSPYHLAVAADAPVAHFPLEETSGAPCASRTTTSAVCVYPPDKLTRGLAGVGGTKAIHFDASTTKLSISGLPGDLSLPYTFELWIRVDVSGADTALGHFMNPSTGNGDGFNLFLWDAAQIRTELWKANSLIAYGLAPTALSANVWHHVVIAHSPGPHLDLFYVDGQLVEHGTNANAARPVVTSALEIHGYVGLVDEIAVYDKTLPAERIAAHYAAQ